ncbi:MAG: HD family hydrolase [Kofleriaceae bacterium]|nr:HD family hydrolase [Myxococcales bacterium]MCB9563290.1 HD family hydrolase [Kofleriaceae bacterium]
MTPTTSPTTPERILATLDGLDPLGDLPRTGWLLRGINPCESIAAHSLAVALLTAMLCDACRDAGLGVDGELALRMALVHDAPEARLGDVPMPVKTPALDAALGVAEARLAAELLTPALVEAWQVAEAGETVEARLVKAADKLQMLHKLWCYERAGRRHPLMEVMWANPANLRSLDLAPVRAVYAALFARAGRPMPTPSPPAP